jgi:hypothetical protein
MSLYLPNGVAVVVIGLVTNMIKQKETDIFIIISFRYD